MNETTERFFREIGERVGSAQVAEVHLFPAIRQGGVESGMAVVAALPVRPVEADAIASLDEHEQALGLGEGDVAEFEVDESDDADDDDPYAEDVIDAIDENAEIDDDGTAEAHDGAIEANDGTVETDHGTVEMNDEAVETNDGADDTDDVVDGHLSDVDGSDDDAAGEIDVADVVSDAVSDPVDDEVEDVKGDVDVTPAPRPVRHVVYTARYRHVIKGPDRGKWEIDVKAEADAPLITVDHVVRGVVHRSGDEVHPERISGDEFRASLAGPGVLASEPASPAPSDSPPQDTPAE